LMLNTDTFVSAGSAEENTLRQKEREKMLVECNGCGKATDKLEIFPKQLCLDCYAESPEGKRMPTAEELVRMWSK
jgi:ribosomal protein L40E